MPPSEHTSIHGVLTIELRDATGELLERRRVANLITNDGKKALANLLGGRVSGAVKIFIGVGKGADDPANQPPKLEDAALRGKLAEAPAEMTAPMLVDGGIRANVRATIPQGGDPQTVLPLTEAGIIVRIGNEPDVLFNRVVFAVINKGSTMSLLLSWDLTF